MPEIQLLDHTASATAKAIWRVCQRSYQLEAEILEVEDFPPLQREVDDICTAKTRFWGMMDQGILQGIIELEDHSQDHFHINSLCVDPDFHRKGIGRKLVNHLVRILPDCLLTVSTGRKNVPACRLYKKTGFQWQQYWQTESMIDMVTFGQHIFREN